MAGLFDRVKEKEYEGEETAFLSFKKWIHPFFLPY
jgi:hypothetical protein